MHKHIHYFISNISIDLKYIDLESGNFFQLIQASG